MAGVTGHKALTNGLFQMLMQAERNVKADVQEAALEAAIAGEEMVRHTIDTTESSLSPGKDNRNWTFEMRRAVDSDVRRNGNTISIRVGWLQTKENYFLIQNDGGQVGQTTITPMNALMAGHTEVLKTLTRWGIKTV
jgi:hypothetical protein